MKDFSLTIYLELIKLSIKKGYSFQPVQDFFRQPEMKVMVVRHDVDAHPEKALQVAKIESELGIRGTFYFKTKPVSFDGDIIRQETIKCTL
jgi:hypothetical protein